MDIKFTIHQPAFSINKVSARDIRFKTAAYKDWYTMVSHEIVHAQYWPQLQKLAETFKLNGGAFNVILETHYPTSIFYAKNGHISAKTYDLTNTEKPLIDLIFGDLMDVNDKNIVRVVSTKHPNAAYTHLKVSITLIDIRLIK